ncbi:hypothetical protein C8R44DRAFT_991820 [Mycena epipterygia]|nr:hypothetical protein C8R44DRAFT_991820 [Mycena epipterygia]
MQFFLVALSAVFVTSVSAAPANPLFARATCNIQTCVVALEPSFPSACSPAATQLGANTPFNIACLAAAAKGTAAFPSACTPCASQFGVTDPANKAATNNNAKGISPRNARVVPIIARATCDIKTCVAALEPSFPSACSPAATQLGANTPFNAACLAAAAKGTAAFPAACIPCASQFGVTDPANKAQATTTTNAKGNTPASPQNARVVAPVTTRATCDIKACVVALEPSFPLCAPAVAQLGADTSFNTACLTAAAKGTAAFPTACGGCAAQFGVTDPGSNTQVTTPTPVAIN